MVIVNKPLDTGMRDFLRRKTFGHAHKDVLSYYKHCEGAELPYQENLCELCSSVKLLVIFRKVK